LCTTSFAEPKACWSKSVNFYYNPELQSANEMKGPVGYVDSEQRFLICILDRLYISTIKHKGSVPTQVTEQCVQKGYKTVFLKYCIYL